MTSERIITAATVTSREKPDGNELEVLVEKKHKAGIEVENVIADTAYSGKENIKLANKTNESDRKNFNFASKLKPVITQGNKKDKLVYYFDVEKCRNRKADSPELYRVDQLFYAVWPLKRNLFQWTGIFYAVISIYSDGS